MDSAAAFLLAAISRPATVGAILPSSRPLAEAMARGADGAQRLVELGAGTGAITAALGRRHPDVPLLAVELDPALARHLRQRFATVEVVAAPADEVLAGLADPQDGIVLVSSLPFRSLLKPLRDRSSLAIERFLLERPGRRLVQYTYLPWEPFALHHVRSLRWHRRTVVWRNVPPAWVWTLQADRGA